MAKTQPEKPAKRGRPPVAIKSKSLPLSASVPYSLLASLDKWRTKNDMTRSQAVTEAIRRMVG